MEEQAKTVHDNNSKTNINAKVLKRKRKYVGCSSLADFDIAEKVGEGTFGEVKKAAHKSSGKTVALKKIFMRTEQEGFPITAIREIKLLKNLQHANVMSLLDMSVSYKKESEHGLPREVDEVFMVFPFMDHDLTGLLENSAINFTLPQIKCYMKQLLEGLQYMHKVKVMHRDMKGANLLVNNKGILKITDFGLARPMDMENGDRYTPCVVTRWYRPPEVLLGSRAYDETVDMWGAGCILAELFLRKPLFMGESDIEQLLLISKFCGSPSEETMPGVSKLEDFGKITIPPGRRKLKEYLKGKELIDSLAVDLIDKLLVLDGKKRLTAEEALKHPFFHNEPLPAQPNQIPQFPSSHEFTVKKAEVKHKLPDRPALTPRHHGDLQIRKEFGHGFDSMPPPPPPPPRERERGREDNRRYRDLDSVHDNRERNNDRERDRGRDRSIDRVYRRSMNYSHYRNSRAPSRSRSRSRERNRDDRGSRDREYHRNDRDQRDRRDDSFRPSRSSTRSRSPVRSIQIQNQTHLQNHVQNGHQLSTARVVSRPTTMQEPPNREIKRVAPRTESRRHVSYDDL